MKNIESPFWNPNTDQPVTLEELKTVDSETQKDVMRDWFFSNYEDPVERTPYEGREGGYIYIYGGPYCAEDELGGVFGEYVPDNIINDLVEELESKCFEWTKAYSEDDYDYSYFSTILSNTEFYKTFLENFENISVLLEIKVEKKSCLHLYRILYASVITVLETFLSDAFINTVLAKPELIRKFVESSSDFKKQKFSLNKLFVKVDNIKSEVGKYLASQMWHNLEKVKLMYRTLGINFPKDIREIIKAIRIRHDIVHRNGKSPGGKETITTKEQVCELMEQVRVLVNHIEDQLDAPGEEAGKGAFRFNQTL